MEMKVLLGERLLVNVIKEEQVTPGGIIIPETAKIMNHNLKKGVVAKKGTGTPWNRMEDIHVKDVVMFRNKSGIPYQEERDGHTAEFLILNYTDILGEP